jgi:hypothetical protein
MIAVGGIVKIAGVADVQLTEVGVGRYVKLFGILDILFAALFVYRKTSKLGFLLICCYLNGAIAAELLTAKALWGRLFF